MRKITKSENVQPPSNWEWRRLGDLAEYINGRAFKPQDWSPQGLPIIRIENLTDPTTSHNSFDGKVEDKYLINHGDLLLSWSASLDAYLWNKGEAVLNQHIFKVCENDSLVVRKFLYYLLRATMARIRLQVHGATMKHITRPIFEAIQVLVPKNKKEQQAIVSLLDIQMAEGQRLCLATQKQFEAANALNETIVNQEITKAGEPKGHLVDILRSLPVSGWPSAYGNETVGTAFLTLTAVLNFEYDGTQVKYTDKQVDQNGDYWAKSGDIFMSRSNTPELVGQAAIYNGTPIRVIFPDLLIRLQPDTNKADIRFVHYWLMSRFARKYITSNARGSSGTMKKITLDMVRMIPFPSHLGREEQQLIANGIDQKVVVAKNLLAAAKRQVEAAIALPNSLLFETFGGFVPPVEN